MHTKCPVLAKEDDSFRQSVTLFTLFIIFNTIFLFLLLFLRSKHKKQPLQPDDSNVSVHSDDSNVDNASIGSEQPATPTSENGRIRPSRPAPMIPTGLSRSATRRSAPPPPIRKLTSTDLAQPQAAPRRSAPSRQASTDENAAYTVRKLMFFGC